MKTRQLIIERNLFARSIEKNDFKAALLEWSFTGGFIDHIETIATCELCEKDHLRYHYEIGNSMSTLQVGSDCITKFDIRVFDEKGMEITRNKGRYLEAFRTRKPRHGIVALKQLLERKTFGMMGTHSIAELDEYCFRKIIRDDANDVRILNYLFLRFEQEGIPYDPLDFPVLTMSNESFAKFHRITPAQFTRIAPALSVTQIDYYRATVGKK